MSEARPAELIVTGGVVITLDAERRVIPDGAVALPIGYDSPGTSLGKPVPVTLTVMYDGATPLGYEAVRPNGWREQYTNAIPPVPTYALSALISPQGEAIRFLTATITVTNNGIPTQLVRLDRVVATDDRTMDRGGNAPVPNQ